MSAKILEALKKLDPTNDNHWTEDGAPRMDTVKMLAADQTLTREQVTAASPGFGRATPLQADAPAAPVTPPVGAVTTPVVDAEKANESLEGSAGARQADTQAQPSDAKSEARARLESAQAALVEAAGRKAAADQAHAAASKAVDEATDALTAAGGVETLSDALGGYFARQQKVRDDRADRMQQLKGIDIKSILPQRAMIDQAMARKTTRGSQRPAAILPFVK